MAKFSFDFEFFIYTCEGAQSRDIICWGNVIDVMINTQITNLVLCDMSKGSLYEQTKPPFCVCVGGGMLFY